VDDREVLLQGLSERQRAAASAPSGRVGVLATAGAGKTTVLARRLAWRAAEGDLDCRHSLVVTFTRRQASELTERLARLGLPSPVAAGTIHARALDELRRRASDLGRRPPVVVSDPERLIGVAIERSGLRSSTFGDDAAAWVAEIGWARAHSLAPEDFADAVAEARRRSAVPPEAVVSVWRAYEAEKRRRGVVDFDDLIEELTKTLEDDPEVRAASRWRWRHLFVDEVQDLTPAQLRLLEAWSGDAPDADLFVVGDFEQSIYGWNGAEPELVRRRLLTHPGCVVVELDENRRSTPGIVAASCRLRSDRPPPVEPEGERGRERPRLVRCPDETAEREAVVRIVLPALERFDHPRPVAVLGRTRALLGPIEAALRQAGVATSALHQEGADCDGGPASVAVGTIHQAKGLEWPCVVVVGLEEGILPSALATSPAALEEERRLCYVAMTRAESELWLTAAATRKRGAEPQEQRPSRFLALLGPCVEAARPEDLGQSGPEDHVARLRQTLTAARLRSRRAVAPRGTAR